MLILAGLCFAGLIGLAAYHYYPKAREKRLLRNARSAMDEGNFRFAIQLANRAAALNPKDPAAMRIKIEIAERFNDPSALTLKSRLVEMDPGSIENRLSLAETALRLQKPAVAKTALEPAQEAGRNNATYHSLAGRAARALHEDSRAMEEFATAARLEPANSRFKFELAVQRLSSTDPEVSAQARAELESWRQEPAFFREATQVLIRDAIAGKQVEKALSLANELQRSPAASFMDRLVFLDLLHETKSTAYPVFLARLQEVAMSSPDDVFALVSWLNAHFGALTAAAWVKEFPPELRSAEPVRIALAESYAMMRNWTSLEPLVTPSKSNDEAKVKTPDAGTEWGEYEYRRLAYLAAILKSKGNRAQALKTWDLATKAAGTNPEAHLDLARFAVAIDWGDATESL